MLTPLDLREVRVGGEIGRRMDITIANNLLKINVDGDFLRPFLEDERRGAFIGLGMLLDSTVKLAAYSDDPQVLALRKHLVAEVLRAQEADGYIGTFPPEKRIHTIWDVHEMGYVIWGLLTDYRYFGEAPSLAAARKAADYLVKNWSVLPPDWGVGADVAPHVAFTGLERTMLGLHRTTGDPAYLDFCTRTRALPQWDLGIVIGRRTGIEGHVYAYLARCLAQLELYRLQPSPELLRPTQRALEFMTEHEGMLVTGSCGQCEIWTGDQDARGDVGEACALAYQLRVDDSLLRLHGDARLGDLMERTIYNGLFASQSPDGRRLRYFAPPEGNRVYWTTDTYCCPCNFRRIISELPTLVFYRARTASRSICTRRLRPSSSSTAACRCPSARKPTIPTRAASASPSIRKNRSRSRCSSAFPRGRLAAARQSTASRAPARSNPVHSSHYAAPGNPATRSNSSCRCPGGWCEGASARPAASPSCVGRKSSASIPPRIRPWRNSTAPNWATSRSTPRRLAIRSPMPPCVPTGWAAACRPGSRASVCRRRPTMNSR